MDMRLRLIIVGVLAVVMFSCKQTQEDSNVIDLDSIDLSDKDNILSGMDTVGTGIPIFYNMYLSVELSSLFETAGAVFDKSKLNPYDKTSEYITSYKKAMNLGVYAVDLSYCRAFEQFDVAQRYFTSMNSLSQQLGIPQNYFEITSQRFEKNITNKDSLIIIANEIYYETESYLKENERFATASVIIMGGWVEALYIGTSVAIESRNPDIIERIVEQKYSLNNLLIMLKDYESNEMITSFIKSLKELQGHLYKLEIEVPADFNINTAEGKSAMNTWIQDIKILQTHIKELRTSIVE